MNKLYRKLKIFLMRWRNSLVKFSDRRSSLVLLFVHSLLDSIFLPISIDFTFLPLVASRTSKAVKFANICLIASIIGAAIGYFIGFVFIDTIGMFLIDTFGFHPVWERLLNAYQGHLSVWTLIVAAITPIPFNVATIVSGATEMNFLVFILISIGGRSIRFYLLAYGIKYFGEKVSFFRNLKKVNRLRIKPKLENAI